MEAAVAAVLVQGGEVAASSYHPMGLAAGLTSERIQGLCPGPWPDEGGWWWQRRGEQCPCYMQNPAMVHSWPQVGQARPPAEGA